MVTIFLKKIRLKEIWLAFNHIKAFYSWLIISQTSKNYITVVNIGGTMKKTIKYMNISLVLFLIGILGFVLNRKNIILMLISIEIMLLAITLLIVVSSLNFDDIVGQTFAVFIISVAGAETAIGLAILIAFYRLRGSIAIEYE